MMSIFLVLPIVAGLILAVLLCFKISKKSKKTRASAAHTTFIRRHVVEAKLIAIVVVILLCTGLEKYIYYLLQESLTLQQQRDHSWRVGVSAFPGLSFIAPDLPLLSSVPG
ncbi:hypothetical protein Pmani_038077 [Petrolisthes manimaculis]|uniref:Uncharacterized protein n=1 Tax=Petrolisthes manimaculis TaxID=1843537 RepID=A0AAE1NGX2_9EUCA|nr:hypothetical protein Pmani_038077 [Petrolisthes manimaculis]